MTKNNQRYHNPTIAHLKLPEAKAERADLRLLIEHFSLYNERARVMKEYMENIRREQRAVRRGKMMKPFRKVARLFKRKPARIKKDA